MPPTRRFLAGHELVQFSLEGERSETPDLEAGRMFVEASRLLESEGLQLEDVVRTRLWGQSCAARDAGSRRRSELLRGLRRAASSSYIASDRVQGNGSMALDVLARAGGDGLEKRTVEHEPSRTPLRYLTVGSLVVISGTTSTRPTLVSQVSAILELVHEMLSLSGGGWHTAFDVACYLHRSQNPAEVRALLPDEMLAAPCGIRLQAVDGFSAVAKLIEFEIGALSA
jgi:hypothetical protein